MRLRNVADFDRIAKEMEDNPNLEEQIDDIMRSLNTTNNLRSGSHELYKSLKGIYASKTLDKVQPQPSHFEKEVLDQVLSSHII